MARKGRHAAILHGALCAAVLAGGAVVFRARIVEGWYLWKLRSADPAGSDRAALKLGLKAYALYQLGTGALPREQDREPVNRKQETEN